MTTQPFRWTQRVVNGRGPIVAVFASEADVPDTV